MEEIKGNVDQDIFNTTSSMSTCAHGKLIQQHEEQSGRRDSQSISQNDGSIQHHLHSFPPASSCHLQGVPVRSNAQPSRDPFGNQARVVFKAEDPQGDCAGGENHQRFSRKRGRSGVPDGEVRTRTAFARLERWIQMYRTETRRFAMQLYSPQIREYPEALSRQPRMEEHAEERTTDQGRAGEGGEEDVGQGRALPAVQQGRQLRAVV